MPCCPSVGVQVVENNLGLGFAAERNVDGLGFGVSKSVVEGFEFERCQLICGCMPVVTTVEVSRTFIHVQGPSKQN